MLDEKFKLVEEFKTIFKAFFFFEKTNWKKFLDLVEQPDYKRGRRNILQLLSFVLRVRVTIIMIVDRW